MISSRLRSMMLAILIPGESLGGLRQKWTMVKEEINVVIGRCELDFLAQAQLGCDAMPGDDRFAACRLPKFARRVPELTTSLTAQLLRLHLIRSCFVYIHIYSSRQSIRK
jgi:hypothetical protein